MKKLLSNAKVLISSSFAIIAIGAIIIVASIFFHFDSQFNKAVTITSAAGSGISVGSIDRTIGFDFGEVFNVRGNGVKLEWNNGIVLGLANASGSITNEVVSIDSGVVYLEVSRAITLILNNRTSQPFTLSEFSGVVFAEDNTVVIMSGSLKDPSGTNHSVNQTLQLNNGGIEVGSFLRQELEVNPGWINLSELFEELQIDNAWLTDRNPPELLSITPDPEIEIAADVNPIEFTFMVNDPDSRIIVNGVKGTATDGLYIISISLIGGENNLSIILEDEWGNRSDSSATYTKAFLPGIEEISEVSPPQQVNTTATCNDGSFRQSLITHINEYRQENGKNSLNIANSLNQASCEHSTWMLSTQCNLETSDCHVGKDSKTPAQRCSNEDTACTLENIGVTTDGEATAQEIFDIWKDNEQDNNNMLGDSTRIGIGASGNYATAVFN